MINTKKPLQIDIACTSHRTKYLVVCRWSDFHSSIEVNFIAIIVHSRFSAGLSAYIVSCVSIPCAPYWHTHTNHHDSQFYSLFPGNFTSELLISFTFQQRVSKYQNYLHIMHSLVKPSRIIGKHSQPYLVFSCVISLKSWKIF